MIVNAFLGLVSLTGLAALAVIHFTSFGVGLSLGTLIAVGAVTAIALIALGCRLLVKFVLPNIVEYLVFAILGSNETLDPEEPVEQRSLMHNLPRIVLGLLLAIAVTYVVTNFKKWEIGAAFAAFIATAALCGVYLVMIFVPMMGEFLSRATLGSNEKAGPSKKNPAMSKLAQGDFEGAVEEYLRLAEAGEEAFPYSEAAKVCADRLGDPDRGIAILTNALHNQEWDQEKWCYLQFRLAEALTKYKHDFEGARACMNDVIENCPETRHSANANAKLKEIEVAELSAPLPDDTAEA